MISPSGATDTCLEKKCRDVVFLMTLCHCRRYWTQPIRRVRGRTTWNIWLRAFPRIVRTTQWELSDLSRCTSSKVPHTMCMPLCVAISEWQTWLFLLAVVFQIYTIEFVSSSWLSNDFMKRVFHMPWSQLPLTCTAGYIAERLCLICTLSTWLPLRFMYVVRHHPYWPIMLLFNRWCMLYCVQPKLLSHAGTVSVLFAPEKVRIIHRKDLPWTTWQQQMSLG